MKKTVLVSMAAVLLSASGIARSDVLYEFYFRSLANDDDTLRFADFEVALRFDDYLTAPGFNAVTPIRSSAPSSIGYQVAYAGVSTLGWWAFDDIEQQALIGDTGFTFDVNSFLFYQPQASQIGMPGTYSGLVSGNGGDPAQYFRGVGTVSVSEVPEPSGLALLATGLAGLAHGRRRRIRAASQA